MPLKPTRVHKEIDYELVQSIGLFSAPYIERRAVIVTTYFYKLRCPHCNWRGEFSSPLPELPDYYNFTYDLRFGHKCR